MHELRPRRERPRAVLGRSRGLGRICGLGDERDAVALSDRLAEPALAVHALRWYG
jgi:hypothetical protein